MKPITPIQWPRLAAAGCAGLLATSLAYGQPPARLPPPPPAPRQALPEGVVSEQYDDNALGNASQAQPRVPATAAPGKPMGVAPAAATAPLVTTIPGRTAVATAGAAPATAGPAAVSIPTVVQPAATGTVAVAPATAAVGTTTSVPTTADGIQAADFGLWLTSDGRGLTVADLATSGPIAGIGLMPGDTIVAINGQPVTTEQQFLRQLLADNLRNEQVNLTIARSGVNQLVAVIPSNLLQGLVQADPLFQAGIVLDPQNANSLTVQQVFPRTPAYYAGLRAGDVISTVSGRPVTNASGLRQAWTPTGSLPVGVTRAGQARNLTFTGSGGLFSQQGRTTANGAAAPMTSASGAATGNPPLRSGAGTGTLFPNSADPRAAAPGSTQRVPVIIPGATNPPAGNPVVPAAPGAIPAILPNVPRP